MSRKLRVPTLSEVSHAPHRCPDCRRRLQLLGLVGYLQQFYCDNCGSYHFEPENDESPLDDPETE